MRHLARSAMYRRFVTVLVAASVAVIAPTGTASADTSADCAFRTDGCFIDRYDDPTIDFGDLDSGNITIPPDSSASGATTNSYPYRRTAPSGSGVTFHGLTNIPAGVNGVDIALYDATLNKNSAGVAQPYLPCKNTGDPYKGACYQASQASYWAVRSFAGGTSSNPWPIGVLVGNSTTNAYCGPCTHNWGRRVYEADLEFYPKKPGSTSTDPNWVRPRFTSRNEFAATAGGNGYNMTTDWGTIAGRYITDPGVGRLSGFVYATTGVIDSNHRLVFSVFPRTPAATSSTGKPVGSFFAGGNGGNGYYTTGAMYAGTYNMTVRDSATGHYCVFGNKTWSTTGLRADFYLDRAHFGRTDYSSCNF
jgi:hypothetical protein